MRVVEEGSFAAAARALDLPRSAVSQAVAGLEAELGVRLLQRSTRAMALTDAGLELHAKVAPALRVIMDAGAAVGDRRGPLRGRVRVTAPVEIGTRLLEPVLSRFLVEEPGVRIDLVLTSRTLDLIEGGIDLAIRGGPIRGADLVARRLGAPQSAGLFAAPSYLARRGAPRRASQLADHDAIVTRGQPHAFRLIGPRGAIEVPVSVRLEVDAWGYATRAAVSGVGIAMLPTFLCEEEQRRGDLVRVLPAYTMEEKPLWLVYPSARNLSRPVSALRDAIAAAFSSPGAGGSRGAGARR